MYLLERLGNGVMKMELEQKAGTLQSAMHHRIKIDVYKLILEKCFC